jgi:plastocyanin
MKPIGIFSSKLLLAAVVSAVLLTGTVLALTPTGITGSSTLGIRQAAADHTPASDKTNEPQTVELDGVTLSFDVQPTEVHAFSKATINMKVADTESGSPLSHVDWVIVIKDSDGNDVYKTSTSHSHVGMNNFSYTFLKPGQNTVHVEVASLGPTMMGMDVPAEAQTRVFASGDPMMSPEVDPNFFFGTRSHDFVVNVGSQGGSQVVTSDMGNRIALSLSTNPERVLVGQPTTLILDVKNAETGMNIMHPDALVTIRQGSFVSSNSAQAGNPMMPMNGALHGHTGQMALTMVFPTTGVYYVTVQTNSLPVSDIQYGHANARFKILVSGDEGSTTGTQTPSTQPQPNQVSILGQAAPYFGPSNLNVSAGETVTFTNDDFVLHTATSVSAAGETTPDGVFDTGLLNNGESAQVTFNESGTYHYFCAIHPQMVGTVTVTG